MTKTQKEAFRVEKRLIDARRGLWDYVPHLKQFWFHSSRNRQRLFTGGNQSGKTTAILAEKLSLRLGYRPWLLDAPYEGLDILTDQTLENEGFKPTNGMLFAKDYTNTVMEVLVPKIRELCPIDEFAMLEKIHAKAIHKLVFWNGSEEKFMTYDQEADKVEGPTWHDIGADEPPPQDHYISAKRGAMAKGAPFLFSFTPLRNPWTKEALYDRAIHVHDFESFDKSQELGKEDVRSPSSIFAVTVDLYDDQPYIPRSEKEEFESQIPEKHRKARIHGQYIHLIGRVYDNFDRNVHVRQVEINPRWPMGLVVDPHPRRPFMMAWFAVTERDDIVFFEEWPSEGTKGWPSNVHGPLWFHEVDNWDWGISGYLEEIHRIEKGDNYHGLNIRKQKVWDLMDPNMGKSPSIATSRSLRDDMASSWLRDGGCLDQSGIADIEKSQVIEGILFDCEINDSLDQGHLIVKQRLSYNENEPLSLSNAPSLWFTPNCRNLVHQMNHYTWQDHRGFQMDEKPFKEKPVEKYKDGPDLVRYVVMKEPVWVDVEDMLRWERAPLPRGYARGGLGS